jgi:iron complex transport system permease protein
MTNSRLSLTSWIVLLLILSIAVLVLGIVEGSVFIDPLKATQIDKTIIFSYRLPRLLEALFIGASLGLSGSVLQIVLRNPLADGFTTGVASSSALGAVLAICFGFSTPFIPVFAVIFGVFGIFAVIFATKNSTDYTTLILAGIVLNILATSFIGFFKYFFEESIGGIVFWLMGGFYSVSYEKAFIVLLVFSAVLFVFLKISVELDIFSFDFSTASSMGVNVKLLKSLSYVLSAILVAVSVSFSGIIAFVGLVVPHIARAFCGYRARDNMVISSFLGGILVVLADILSRTIMPTSEELPIGILTSIIGGLFFFYLLIKKKSSIWYV